MWRDQNHFRMIGAYLVLAMFLIGTIPADIFAAMVPSVPVGAMAPDREKDMEKIRTALESRIVSTRLADLGLPTDEIEARMASLDPDTLHQTASRIDDLRSGSDGAISALIGLLIIAILLVVLLKLLGRKIVIE